MTPDQIVRYTHELYDRGVKGILTVSYDRRSSLEAAKITEIAEPSHKAGVLSLQEAAVFCACGIHPEHAEEKFPEELISDEASFKKSFCAIGEIGLDYRDGMPPRELQQSRFEEQLVLCRNLKLPAVIHSVRACDDTLRTMKRFKGLSFVMHGFSYSAEAAREYVKLGAYIGIGTRILDERARRLPETVREVAEDRLMIETDIPFCRQFKSTHCKTDSLIKSLHDPAETSHHPDDTGAATHADLLTDIVNKISAIKQIPTTRIEGITQENAERFLIGD